MTLHFVRDVGPWGKGMTAISRAFRAGDHGRQ
jgi:hypothetical protein